MAREARIDGVTPRCEFGLEILVVLAFVVYVSHQIRDQGMTRALGRGRLLFLDYIINAQLYAPQGAAGMSCPSNFAHTTESRPLPTDFLSSVAGPGLLSFCSTAQNMSALFEGAFGRLEDGDLTVAIAASKP